MTKTEARTDNSGFAKKRVQGLIEHSTTHQHLWCIDSFVLRNPLLRKAAKRCTPLSLTAQNIRQMLDFNISPFNTLPLNGSSLFNLTCDYLISLFEKMNIDYHKLLQHATELTLQLTDPNCNFNFEASKHFVFLSESVIDTYSKIVKCAKLSLGSNVGRVKSKHTVFQPFEYSPNHSLQDTIVHGLRNTQQHFEERLQDHDSDIDPFIQISYAGPGKQWKIVIGSEGFRSSGASNGQIENFNINNLFFHSYTQDNQKKLKPSFVSIGEIWADTLKIIDLLKDNMQAHLAINESCNCPRFTYLGVIVTPYNN